MTALNNPGKFVRTNAIKPLPCILERQGWTRFGPQEWHKDGWKAYKITTSRWQVTRPDGSTLPNYTNRYLLSFTCPGTIDRAIEHERTAGSTYGRSEERARLR